MGARCIELGAGPGLAGLFMAKMGAKVGEVQLGPGEGSALSVQSASWCV